MSETSSIPSPDEAAAALRRLMQAWDLDRLDAMALVHAGQADFSAIAWTEEQRARVACLVELEKALPKLDPRGGIPRLISTPKPGPFFGDQSPLRILMGPTQDMVALLREVRAWTGRR
jgi:hypothetical protein